MKALRLLLLLTAIAFPMSATATGFEEIYAIELMTDYAVLADQVVSARFDNSEHSLEQQFTGLKNLQARLQAASEKNRDDPIIWFLSGLNLNNLAELRYLIRLQKAGQQSAADDIEVSNYNIARSRAYDNAIRLDNQQPHLLSSSIYATMGYGLTNKQKIKTYSRELELGSASENESNEWFMHWAKIDLLVHEKKIDEAQQALKELKQLLEEKNRASSPYVSIATRAQKQVEKVVAQSNTRKASQAKPTSSNKLDSPAQPWSWKNWLLLCIGVVTFLSVLTAAIFLRRD